MRPHATRRLRGPLAADAASSLGPWGCRRTRGAEQSEVSGGLGRGRPGEAARLLRLQPGDAARSRAAAGHSASRWRRRLQRLPRCPDARGWPLTPRTGRPGPARGWQGTAELWPARRVRSRPLGPRAAVGLVLAAAVCRAPAGAGAARRDGRVLCHSRQLCSVTPRDPNPIFQRRSGPKELVRPRSRSWRAATLVCVSLVLHLRRLLHVL